MLRATIIPPVLVIATAVFGVVACRVLGVDPHLRTLLGASAVCLAVAELSIVPSLLTTETGPAAAFQAAFLGTVIHLGLVAAAAGAVVFTLKPDTSFVYWVLLMYWVTLIGLCVGFIRSVRSSAQSAAKAA